MNKEKGIPHFRTVVWMWFAVACVYSFANPDLLNIPFHELGLFSTTLNVLQFQLGAAQIHEWISFSLYVGTFCFTVLALKKGHFEYQMQQLAWTMLSIILVTMQSKGVILNVYNGLFWVVFPATLVIVNDVMAYFCGVALGRKIYKGPFLPDLSPNKTWEGFAGAVVGAVAAGILLGIFMLGIPWWAGAILGAVILGTATTGDLGESMVKRDLGIKDMSSWLPGHGGVLDRLDSILPSATAALALYYLFSPLVAS